MSVYKVRMVGDMWRIWNCRRKAYQICISSDGKAIKAWHHKHEAVSAARRLIGTVEEE